MTRDEHLAAIDELMGEIGAELEVANRPCRYAGFRDFRHARKWAEGRGMSLEEMGELVNQRCKARWDEERALNPTEFRA